MTLALNDRGAFLTRKLPNGRIVDVFSLTFGRARLTISADLDALGYDDGW